MGGIYLHAARLADYLSTIEPCCRSRKASNFVAISLSSKNEPELRRKMREQRRRPFPPRPRRGYEKIRVWHRCNLAEMISVELCRCCLRFRWMTEGLRRSWLAAGADGADRGDEGLVSGLCGLRPSMCGWAARASSLKGKGRA